MRHKEVWKSRSEYYLKKFLDKIDKSQECWIWLGGCDENGYGEFGNKRTHRLMWRLIHGEIKNNLFVLHKCDNPKCVNPDHLFLGTNLDNIHDMIAKGRNIHVYLNKMGGNTKTSKLTEEQAILIKASPKNIRIKYIAEKFNICISQAWNIIRGNSWINLQEPTIEEINKSKEFFKDCPTTNRERSQKQNLKSRKSNKGIIALEKFKKDTL